MDIDERLYECGVIITYLPDDMRAAERAVRRAREESRGWLTVANTARSTSR